MMKFVVVLLSALAAASAQDGVFHFSSLKGLNPLAVHPAAVYPRSYMSPYLAHQPVYNKYVNPAYYHAPSAYSRFVDGYHHSPVYSSLVDKHVPVVLPHPAVTPYSAIAKPAAFRFADKLHPTMYASAYATPRIIQQSQDMDSAVGAYSFNYATENGIQATEQSSVKGVGPEGVVSAKQGAYSYTGPDGVVYTVNWVADENGYRAYGAHLPQMPEEIERSLHFNALHPTIEDVKK